MKIDRITRVNELLRREIAESMLRVMAKSSEDPALITITHVKASRNLRHARVLVSIMDSEARRKKLLSVIRKHSGEIQAAINKDLGLKYTPVLYFCLDPSLEKGDKVLQLLSEMEQGESSEGDEQSE
ncbi:MAG: 30S ribosome-binding factor RbfA [Kiritimatiellae bacterium]|nr:30S ribosome-binding factor RbfA [Kiritimatiellia bacterium]